MSSEMDDVLRNVVDTRREREAEDFLKKNMRPIPGSCVLCLGEEGEHESWCQIKKNREES